MGDIHIPFDAIAHIAGFARIDVRPTCVCGLSALRLVEDVSNDIGDDIFDLGSLPPKRCCGCKLHELVGVPTAETRLFWAIRSTCKELYARLPDIALKIRRRIVLAEYSAHLAAQRVSLVIPPRESRQNYWDAHKRADFRSMIVREFVDEHIDRIPRHINKAPECRHLLAKFITQRRGEGKTNDQITDEMTGAIMSHIIGFTQMLPSVQKRKCMVRGILDGIDLNYW